jgi:hypothetical protein
MPYGVIGVVNSLATAWCGAALIVAWPPDQPGRWRLAAHRLALATWWRVWAVMATASVAQLGWMRYSDAPTPVVLLAAFDVTGAVAFGWIWEERKRRRQEGVAGDETGTG